jgi:hypothetical protein
MPMIKRILIIFLSFCATHVAFAQNKEFQLKGQLLDLNSKGIENAHIVNLTTKTGTISNSKGNFSITVRLGDWLEITNLQYQTKKVRITQSNVTTKTKLIYLISITNTLEEVVIKKRMIGFLRSDRIEKGKDTLPKVDKGYYDFSKMDIKIPNKVYNKGDALYNTDPTIKNAPVKMLSARIPDKSLIKRRALKKKLNFKEQFPIKLKQLLGEDYFHKKLKIPKDNYYHFLDYCTPLGIEELFKQENYLELLKILLKESKSYLLLIEKDK